GRGPLDDLDGLVGVARLAHDGEVLAQVGPHARPPDRVVVGDHHPHLSQPVHGGRRYARGGVTGSRWSSRRWRNAAMAWRLTGAVGRKAGPGKPSATPAPTAQAMSAAKVEVAGTSLKPGSGAGASGASSSRSSRRWRKAA